jgi:hypothetical protein
VRSDEAERADRTVEDEARHLVNLERADDAVRETRYSFRARLGATRGGSSGCFG